MIVFQSCSSTGYWTEEKCFNCDEMPLSYQEPIVYFGTVTGIHDGTYIQSVCLGFDINFASFTSGSIFKGANFFVSVETGDGDFCSPNDESTYKVTIIDNPFDSGEESVIILPGSAFKKAPHSSNDPPEASIPIAATIMLGLVAGGTTVLNSKTKFGGIALAVVSLFQLWLPVFGVEVVPQFWDNVFTSLEVLSGVLILFGIRDAFYKSP